MLLSLRLNGRPISMKHNLLTKSGGFAFKIAFDEKFSKYSPGLLLELESIRRVCEDSRIPWMDSCAAARHPMANRIWRERRMIRRSLISNGSATGDFCVSALPVLRWAARLMGVDHTPDYLKVAHTH